ncbi:hypothetical protein [Sphingobacterium faecium]|uniref:hypothetical protein n=1 Tax=Sphingobacterium faecium TaxID=34087 RepID=UPI003208951C
MEIELSFMEVVQKSNLTEKEVYREIDYLEKEKEIHIDEINYSTYYLILKQGSVSYFDKKYLELGRKNFRDNLFDNLKIISSFILLLIAVITFIVNLLETRKNRTEIEKLKNEIIILKGNRQK